MFGLLTDLYELTMAAGYFEAGKSAEPAVFELAVRRLPRGRTYIIAAGIEQAVDYLVNLRFTGEEIDYLRSLPQFQRASPAFFDYLASLRFTGRIEAVAEGTPLYAGEPMMTVWAPLIEGQIVETYLLATLTFQTLIATKASLVTAAAQGRAVIEFGTRRAHTPQAGVLGARAAYIGGCAGTSNTLAGFRFGIPVMGTSAHSWVLAFPSEMEAFRRLQELLGPQTVQLIDTYDTIEGARRVASLGPPLWGVRLDSGDLDSLSRRVRKILDEAGLRDAKIMASSDLDETRIAQLVSAGAPIDSFGVGTELATSGDAPSMGSVYKLVEINGQPVAKFSESKGTLPGAKQIFRFAERDVLALATEPCPSGAMPLLRRDLKLGDLAAARALAASPVVRRVEHSEALTKLQAKLERRTR